MNSISLRIFNADFCGNKPHGKSGLMIFCLNWHNYSAFFFCFPPKTKLSTLIKNASRDRMQFNLNKFTKLSRNAAWGTLSY